LSKYGGDKAGSVDAPKDDFIIQFGYEMQTGKSHQYKKPSEKEKENNDENKEGFFDKYIKPYGYAGFWVPSLIIIGLV
jgi:hypothetical protein